LNAGDIESMPFIQALGHFSYRVGENNTWSIHKVFHLVLNCHCGRGFGKIDCNCEDCYIAVADHNLKLICPFL
jgi:hypothetical protein